jgi:hypothetical protein
MILKVCKVLAAMLFGAACLTLASSVIIGTLFLGIWLGGTNSLAGFFITLALLGALIGGIIYVVGSNLP